MANKVSRPKVCRRAWTVVALLVAIQTGLLAYGAYVHSPTLNEPAHLAAGLSHWQLGEFALYRVNPPLVRMVAALPVLSSGVETDWHRFPQDNSVRADFVVGDDLIAANGERSFFLFMVARWACIPFAWIGSIVCFLWARDLYGTSAGLWATTLWCFSPNLLAHSSLIGPDAPATALFVLAGYLFWQWLRKPMWKRVLLAGAAIGTAELAKSTFIVLYLFLPLLWALDRFSNRTKTLSRNWSREGAMLLVCLSVSVFVTNLGYRFDGSFTPLGQFRFASQMFSGRESHTLGNRFTNTLLSKFPVPFPQDYVLGMDVLRHELEHLGRPSYLKGDYQDRGWWYYYLYALAIKVPLGTWGLLLFTSTWRLVRRGQVRLPCSLRDEFALLLPAMLILIVVSSQTGFSEHLRYVLPIAPFVFIWISQIALLVEVPSAPPATNQSSSWEEYPWSVPTSRRPWGTVLATVLLGWSISSSLWIYPHSLAFFNELVGGPPGGHAHLLGSNVDWGQDLRYLQRWLDKHPNIGPLSLAYCGRGDPRFLGIDFSAPPPSAPDSNHIPELQPGWYAVSVNFLRGYPWFAADGQGGYVVYERDALSYFLKFRPTAIIGASIYIYRVKSSLR